MAKISCSNYGYREWRLPKVIPSMARIGYKGIEIVTEGVAGRNHLNPDSDQSYIDEVNGLLEHHGMRVACVSPGNDFYKPRRGTIEEEIKHVTSNVDLAVKVGAPVIRVQAAGLRGKQKPYRLPEGVSRSKFIETIAGPLSKCVDYGRSRGVKLAIETHANLWAAVPENMRDLLDAVRSDYLGICLHTLLEYAVETVSTLGDKILHLHLSDTSRAAQRAGLITRLRSRGLGDSDIMKELRLTREEFEKALTWQHREIHLGEGEVNFKTIFQGLRDAGYPGWWNYEGHSTDNPEEYARRAYIYINKLLREK